MKVSIETIGGKQCTVIRKDFDVEWVKKQLSIPLAVNVTARLPNGLEPTRIIYNITDEDGVELFHTMVRDYTLEEANELIKHITILPALPRRPKPEDAKLLYRYCSENLLPHGCYAETGIDGEPVANEFHAAYFDLLNLGSLDCLELDYCEDAKGNKIDVAIEDYTLRGEDVKPAT